MALSTLTGDGFSVSFTEREVTAWGGLALLKRMLDSMGFRQALSSWGLPAPGSNRGYDPAHLIEQFIVSIMSRPKGAIRVRLLTLYGLGVRGQRPRFRRTA